ncbi:AraC family transcriptional regulator [Pedobacter sp. UYP1]|uniref:helix-turn-helix domain-containing protein n=1 Tax=Pedobacter sp. UYP1 TaxID=1756396 RepID=UPI003392CE9C
MLAIQNFHPPECLRNYVKYFWYMDANALNNSRKCFRIFPDGLPGLLFHHHNGQQVLELPDGQKLPSSFIYGLSTHAFTNYSSTGFSAIGVSLYPWAFHRIFKIDSVECSNNMLALDDLTAFTLNEKLFDAPNADTAIKILSGYLIQKVNCAAREDQLIKDSIRQINNNPNTLIRDLSKSFGLSERQFERRFKQTAGISPYQYFKVLRFQRSLTALNFNLTQSLSAVAYCSGFADQSHFIREFKQYSGITPNSYLKLNQQNQQILSGHIRQNIPQRILAV